MEAKQVPLTELLEAVPADARLVVDDGPYSTRFIPVGKMCHEAAVALRERLAQPVQRPVLQDIEQYRMQMAGISTAAIGYWKEGDDIHPDYDTVALRDVAKLYAKYDALYKAQPEQEHIIDCPRCGHCCPADLIAAAERERCAELCDSIAANSVLGTANECAVAIRARSKV